MFMTWVVFVWRERASARAEKAHAQRNLARLPELERQMQSGQPVASRRLASAWLLNFDRRMQLKGFAKRHFASADAR
jgi:hypothetical protein